MHKRIVLLIIWLFAAFPLLRAQCPNLDFSYGDFRNWKYYASDSRTTGQTCYDSLQWKFEVSAEYDRLRIMSDIYGDDPRTCNNGMSPSLYLPLIPDGFSYSARIGNAGTGSCADAIRYAIVVDSSNYWVTVHYAAVLELANHVDEMESRFGIRFQDTAGKPLPVGNLEFSIKDTARMIKCGMVYWTEWEDLSVNLSAWIGQTVELVIYAMDCGKNGHYGYGYAVCECGSPKGNVRYCNNSSIAELSAPTGCRSYRWTDTSGKVVDSVRVMKVANPAIGDVYRCVVDNGMGNDTISLQISKTWITPSFLVRRDSLSHWISLRNSSQITGSVFSGQTWQIGKPGGRTEFVGNDSIFEYLFKDTGLYEIKLTVNAANGCSDTTSIRLRVDRYLTDAGIVGYSFPKGDTLLGSTLLHPGVMLANRGHVGVYGAQLKVVLFDSLLRPLDSLKEQVPQIPADDTVEFRFTSFMKLPNYTGIYALKADLEVSIFDDDTVSSNNTLLKYFRLRHRDTVDVRLVSVVSPTVDGLPGNMQVTPVVRVYNHSNIPVGGIRLKGMVLDSSGRVLDSMSAGVSSLLPEESAECRFTASYRVPLYNGRYYFKVCLAAHPQDVDLSNDTLVRMAFCLHLDTVDVAVMDILYPVASDTLDAGFACGLKVRVSNTGNRDLRALPLHALVMDGKRVVKDTLEGIISGFGHGDTVDYMFPGSFRIPETAGDFYLKVFTDAVRVDLFRANDTIVRKRTCMRLSDTVDVHLLSVVSPSVTDTLFGGSSVSPSVCAAYNGNVRLPLLNMRMVVSDSSHRVLDSIPFTFLMAIQNGDTFRVVFNNSFRVPNYTGRYFIMVYAEAHVSEKNLLDDTLTVVRYCLHRDSVDLYVADVLSPGIGVLRGDSLVYPKVRLCSRSNVAPKDVSLQLLVVRPNGMADTLFEKVGALRPRDTVDYLFVNPYRVPNINGSYCLKIRPISVEKDYNPGNDEFICWFNAYRFDTVDVVPVSFVLADTLLGASTVRPVLQMVNRSTADVSGFSFWADAADSAGNLLCAWNEGNLSIMAGDTLSVRLGKAFRLPNFTGKIRMRAAVSQYPKSYALLECDTLVQFFQCVHSDTVDVALASLLYPVTTEVLQGHTEVFPQVRVVNRGNVAVRNIALAALVYGQDGMLADSVPGFIPLLDSGADTLYVFPTPYLVPNVAGSYSLTVRMTAPDGDVSEKDNELQRKLMSKKNLTVDLQMLEVTLSDTGVLAGGTWVFPHVRVANPLRNTVASGVFVYAELLDSSGMQLALLHGSIDRIGMADTAGLWFADSFCVPDYTGVFMVRAFVEGYGHEADYSNDTLQCVFSCQKSDAVTSFFRENWQLGQNTPNPAVERTLVPITLPEAGRVRLQMCSADGRLMYRGERELPPGKNMLPLDVGGYAAGIYYFSVEYRNERRTIKISVR